MKKWMTTFFVFCVSSVALAGSISSMKIEIRPVVEGTQESAVDMKSHEGTVFHVSQSALLTEKSLLDASVTPAGDHSTLNLSLTAEGAQQMKQFSSQHMGSKLAFIVNGELLNAPTVRAPIRDGKVVISFMSEDQALKLARSIHQTVSQ